MLPRLETKRLILRRTELSDADQMFLYASRPDAGRTAGWQPHKTVQDSQTVLRAFEMRERLTGLGMFAIVYKQYNLMIGTIGFASIKAGVGELAYALSSDYWGQGIIAEVLEAILEWSFTELNLKAVRCLVNKTNENENNTLLNLQFTNIATRPQAFQSYDNRVYDLNVYEMTKEEWLDA